MSERARFTATGRWLVCSGAPQFLDVASKAVGAGFQGGIEWLPEVDDAIRRVKEHYRRAAGCIVAAGCLGADPHVAASRIAGVSGGVMVILVDDDADLGQNDPLLDDVDVVIPSGMLLSALVGLAEHSRAAKRPGVTAQVLGDVSVASPQRSSYAPGPRCASPAPVQPPNRGQQKLVVGWPEEDLFDRYPPDEDFFSPPPSCSAQRNISHAGAETTAAPGMRATGSIPRVINPVTASLQAESLPVANKPNPVPPASDVLSPDEVSAESPPGRSLSQPSGKVGPGEVLPDNMAPDLGASSSTPDKIELFSLASAHKDTPHIQVVGPPESGNATEATPTICVASARGGVGKSALAALMAISLAQSGLTVALIDVDFQFGTCLGFLGADETDGLTEALGLGESVVLDERALTRCRATPAHGVLAYEFCRLPERAELLVPHVGSLVRAARTGADIAVVDLPAGMSEGVAQALETADRCVLVGDQRALCLESMGAMAALCARAGIPGTKLVSLINRCDPRHRDETFLARARFELKTPQVLHVLDGGPDVDALLSCGSAAELLESRNRAALSAADVAHTLAAELGCSAPQTTAQPARPAVLLGKVSRFRKGRAGGRAGAAPCPS